MLAICSCDIQEVPSFFLYQPLDQGVFLDPVDDVSREDVPNIDLVSLEFDLSDEVVIAMELDSLGGYTLGERVRELSSLAVYSSTYTFGLRFDSDADNEIDMFLDFTIGQDVPATRNVIKSELIDRDNEFRGDSLFVYLEVYNINRDNEGFTTSTTAIEVGNVRTIAEGNRLFLQFSDFNEIHEALGFYFVSAFDDGTRLLIDAFPNQSSTPLRVFGPGLYGG